jgi:tRNA dimethylallyltransferase
MLKKSKKAILILGATASGKSSLAFELVSKENGEIINVDSRQLYRGMEKFSGLAENEKKNRMVAFLDPEKDFSAGDFVEKANGEMEEVFKKGKTPILAGGTTFYFSSLVYKNSLPKVEKNVPLRQKLEKKTLPELLELLKEKDENRYQTIDKNNPPRVIRALEIIEKIGFVPEARMELRGD